MRFIRTKMLAFSAENAFWRIPPGFADGPASALIPGLSKSSFRNVPSIGLAWQAVVTTRPTYRGSEVIQIEFQECSLDWAVFCKLWFPHSLIVVADTSD